MLQELFSFSQTIQIQNATMTLICMNTSADYAGGGKNPGSVYQPKSEEEAIFNSLEKHTLRGRLLMRALHYSGGF